LAEADYKDSKSIFNEMYKWKANIYFNKSTEDTTKKLTSLSKYGPVIVHFTVTGGKPGEIEDFHYDITLPSGELRSGNTGDMKGRYKYWYGWEDGLYVNPAYGATGTLSVRIYYSSGNLVGQSSVSITG